MTEKELISKLNRMHKINLDAAWLKGQREVLRTQIDNTGASDLSAWEKLLCELKALTLTASRPAVSVASFVLLVAVFGVFSHHLFSSAQPNDSLYIARIISEKAKVNMTFNDENRNKLEAKFAASHAQDIAAALTDESVSGDPIAAQDLSDKFDKEIDTVKRSLAKANKDASVQDNPVNEEIGNQEGDVFVADSGKDNAGIQISASGQSAALPVESSSDGRADELLGDGSASSSVAIEADESSSTSSIDITEEVKLYFDKKDYNGAIDKLKELEESIK